MYICRRASVSELSANVHGKAILSPKIVLKAERSEVLGDFGGKIGFPDGLYRRANVSELSVRSAGKPFWGRNRSKGAPKGLLGDFVPKKDPETAPDLAYPKKGVFLGVLGKTVSTVVPNFTVFRRFLRKTGRFSRHF